MYNRAAMLIKQFFDIQSSWNGGQMEPSDWYSGAGSSPRKEYISSLENWRKGCHMGEEVPTDSTVGSGEGISEAKPGNSSIPPQSKFCKSSFFQSSFFLTT